MPTFSQQSMKGNFCEKYVGVQVVYLKAPHFCQLSLTVIHSLLNRRILNELTENKENK